MKKYQELSARSARIGARLMRSILRSGARVVYDGSGSRTLPELVHQGGKITVIVPILWLNMDDEAKFLRGMLAALREARRQGGKSHGQGC